MRAEYEGLESALEEHVYEIRDGSKPVLPPEWDFLMLPSELPRLKGYNNGFDFEFVYTVNLDHEDFSVNHSTNWKLWDVPRQDDLLFWAIADSKHRDKRTFFPNFFPEERMASLASESPKRIQE